MQQTELNDAGIVQELNRLFLHPMGMELRMTSSTALVIDDYRAVAAEGHIFFNHDPVAFKAREQERVVRVFESAPLRQGAYGWIVQPIEEVLGVRKIAPPRP